MSNAHIKVAANMRFALQRIGRVVFVRWYEAPGKGDLAAIVDALAVAKREAGAALVQIDVVSANAGIPSLDATREVLAGIWALKHYRAFHPVVIEGDDAVQRALIRGIYSIMAFALSENLALFDTIDEAATQACAVVGQDPRDVLRELSEAGLMGSSPGPARDAATLR